MERLGDYKTFIENLPDSQYIGKGSESTIWSDNDDYVYKVANNCWNLEEFKKQLEQKNAIPEYETEELIGYMVEDKKIHPVTRQRKLINHENFIKKFLSDQGFTETVKDKYTTYYTKDGINIRDVHFSNIGFTKDGKVKLLDIRLYVDTH